MLPLQLRMHYFGLGSGKAVCGTLSVSLKMPFESTLLHFTCFLCRNSIYSRNKTIQSTKLHILPNGTSVGVCFPKRVKLQVIQRDPKQPLTKSGKISNITCSLSTDGDKTPRNIIKEEPSLYGDGSIKHGAVVDRPSHPL